MDHHVDIQKSHAAFARILAKGEPLEILRNYSNINTLTLESMTWESGSEKN